MHTPPERPLAGMRALVTGVANADSIAYGCARAFADLGAQLIEHSAPFDVIDGDGGGLERLALERLGLERLGLERWALEKLGRQRLALQILCSENACAGLEHQEWCQQACDRTDSLPSQLRPPAPKLPAPKLPAPILPAPILPALRLPVQQFSPLPAQRKSHLRS